MAEDAREQIARALAGAGVLVPQAFNPDDLARIVLAVPAVAEALAAVGRVRALAEEAERDAAEWTHPDVIGVVTAEALRRALDGDRG